MIYNTPVMVSLHPSFYAQMSDGQKQVEFRRRIPSTTPDLWIIYCTSPVQKIAGGFLPGSIIRQNPRWLWEEYNTVGGISRESFDMYFHGVEEGYAITVAQFFRLKSPIALRDLSGFTPPQSFIYLRRKPDLWDQIKGLLPPNIFKV